MDSPSEDGVKIFYEVYGDGRDDGSCCCRPWSIIHSRCWKMQIPYLARSHRVITFDLAAMDSSDRPLARMRTASGSSRPDALAVLDATGS